MIEIRRGEHTLKVSRDTFKTMFERMGYQIVGEEVKKSTSSTNKNEIPSKNNKRQNIDIEKKNEEVKSDDFISSESNLSVSEEKTAESQPDAKLSKSEEAANKLDDILGIISNNKTKLNSKKNKEE